MRTISPFEFVRRFHHGVTNHDGRFVWFLGAGCSVSSGIADAADTTRRWLSELKYLETGDTGGLEDWARARFERYDADDLAPLYGSVLNELFYTGQEQERELERINSAAEPGFGYATLAQLVTHANWGERCNTIVTTNFDDLAADALYLYSQQRPQVLTHESFDRRIRISTARPTILKIYGDAHLAEAGSHAGETLLRPDVKDRLRAQFTESSLVFVGYGGRDESVCDLLSGLPSGAPAGGIFWINARDPAPAMLEWLEGRNAVATPYSDFEGLMFLIRREFRLGHPRIDRFDQILKRYDAQFRALAAREDLQRQTGGGSRAPAPMPLPEEETPVGKLAFPPAEPDPEPEAAQAPELTVEASEDSAEISDAARISAIAAGLETLDEDDPWPGEFRDSFEAEDVIPHDEEPDAAEADANADAEPSAFNGSSFAAMPEEDTVSADGSPEASDEPEPASIEDETLPAQEPDSAEEAAPSTIPHGRIDRLIAAAVEAMASEQRDVERARAEAAAAADDEEAARSAAAPVRLLDDEDDEAEAEHPAVAALDDPEETAPEQPVVNEAPAREARGNIAPFPGRFSQRLELPRRLLGRSDAAELDRRYLAALQDTPNNPKLLGRYAQFLATGKRDNDGAEHYFNRAIDADPQDGEVLRAFASFLTDVRRDYDRAEDCYRLALRADFDDTVTLCAYANFLWKSRGDLQAAGECFQVAVDGAPRDSRALCSYARFLRDVAHNEDAAYALLKLAVASTRFDPAPSVELARFLATSRGEMAKAESTFRHALRVAPDSAETLAAAASFFADSLGDLDEGERLFRQAVAADKDEPVVLRAYASFKARHRGDMDAAEHLLGRAIDADPGDCTTALAYARFLEEEKRDADGADEYYRRAVHLDPRNAEALAAYARFLYRVRNNPAAAEDRFRKAIKMEPKNPDVQAGYGHFLLTAREDLDAAEPLLRAALGGMPNNPELLWDLGKLNRARGDSDGANEMFRRAVDADPRRAADLRRFSRFSKCERGDGAGASPGDQIVESAGSDDPASLGGAAQAMFALGRAEEGISLLNNAFEAALAEDPGHRDPNLLLELWFCRFVFHDEARSDAVKAVTWLVKSGARMEPREVEALVATDLARAHPDQDMLADVASIVSGASRLEDIKEFNVA